MRFQTVISLVLISFCAAVALMPQAARAARSPSSSSATTVTGPASSSTPEAKIPAPTASALASKVAVIPIHGDIDYGLQKSLERRAKAALDAGAEVLFFEMDTYGGGLDPGAEMGDFINNMKTQHGGKVKTVAYVKKKAISAGALISLACQQIVMRHGTTLGDCQAIMITSNEGGMTAAPEKVQSMVRALMRKYSQSNGYPQALCEKMVDPDMEVYQVRFPDGAAKYLTNQQLEELPSVEKRMVEKKLIVGKGKLLTMSDAEAHEYGFSRASVNSLDDAIALYAKPGAQRVSLETNWSEEMVRFLNSTAVSSLLMVVGMVALYMAFKTPGFGMPELVAISCFAILFLSKYTVGLATALDIVLFAAGVILVAVEIFVFPGFIVFGLAGIACMIAALILALQKFAIPRYDFEVTILIHNLFLVFGSLLAATGIFMLIVRFLPKTPFLNKLVLSTAQTPETGYVVISAEQRGLVGKAGVATSMLRPAGRAEIDGQPTDVVTDGEFIEPGGKVVVTEVRGNRIVVRRA